MMAEKKQNGKRRKWNDPAIQKITHKKIQCECVKDCGNILSFQHFPEQDRVIVTVNKGLEIRTCLNFSYTEFKKYLELFIKEVDNGKN